MRSCLGVAPLPAEPLESVALWWYCRPLDCDELGRCELCAEGAGAIARGGRWLCREKPFQDLSRFRGSLRQG